MAASPQAFRLLIIDDSANIHDDLRKVLAQPVKSSISELEAELFGESADAPEPEQIPFQIDSAFQGDDGVALLKRALEEGSPYALAFVDMRMPPGLDGLATIEKLWAVDAQLQIVICSAYSDYSWSEIHRRLGPTDRLVILRKPFENIEVLQLAHCLTEKWSLQQRVERQLRELEKAISQRTWELEQNQTLLRLIAENAPDLVRKSVGGRL